MNAPRMTSSSERKRFLKTGVVWMIPAAILMLSTIAVPESKASAAGFPVTGTAAPGMERLDRAMFEFMVKEEITGGVFAFMKDGMILMQRG